MMPYRLRFLVRFRDEIDLDLHLELTPSCFGDFERRGLDGAERVRIGFVEFELDLFDEVGEVGVWRAGANVEGPLVGVIGVYG